MMHCLRAKLNEMNSIHRVDVLGCPFDAISFSKTESEIRRAILDGRSLQIVPGNIDMVMKARRNSSFAKRLWKADLVIADGQPIVWAASLLREPICGRVSGTDLVWSCAALSAQNGWSIALIGGKGEVAARAAQKMRERYPTARLHALPTPMPLCEKENAELVTRIKACRAKIVLVALGAPRQEEWIASHLVESGSLIGIGVGSAFDIISGDRPRAPQWMQDCGFEWFYRMLQEPRRLGRRYLVEDSPFLYHLALAVLRRNRRREKERYGEA
jgi:N-acetylglucosaminyldiphosphoundecaprenol N-acetyl-beta-D-mannosaminyltransferase